MEDKMVQEEEPGIIETRILAPAVVPEEVLVGAEVEVETDNIMGRK